MPAPQTLMQAALARLGARLGSGLVDAAANLALVVQDAPERLRQELELFWDEVEQEADRLERHGQDAARAPGDGSPDGSAGAAGDLDPSGAPRSAAAHAGPPPSVQDQIDALRARVAELNRRLDGRP